MSQANSNVTVGAGDYQQPQLTTAKMADADFGPER